MKPIRTPCPPPDNGRAMQEGFSTFRFNDASAKHDDDDLRHVMSFDTYDQPTLDDLIEFEAWLSQSDLLLRCAETRVITISAYRESFLRIEVSGILIDNKEQGYGKRD